MSTSRLSEQFLETAKARLSDENLKSEGNLRRATSDLYYAVFHAICEALVEPLGADASNDAFVEVYTNIYRLLNHGYAEEHCKKVARNSRFSPEINRFAKHFTTMKNKREAADYDPLAKMAVSVVRNDLEITETRMRDFRTADSAERVTFACFVGMRNNRSQKLGL